MHVGLILGLAEQGKLLRKIVKNNYWYKTTPVQTVSWKKREDATNEQSVPLGVRAEKMKGLFVYSFSEKDAEIRDNCLTALSKTKEKYFFVCNTEINVEHNAAHLGLRARSLTGNLRN